MGAEIDTTTEKAGAATTDANVRGFTFQVAALNDRPEYASNMKRVGEKLGKAFQDDPDLYRAFSYLASDTPFAIYVMSKDEKRIILPR